MMCDLCTSLRLLNLELSEENVGNFQNVWGCMWTQLRRAVAEVGTTRDGVDMIDQGAAAEVNAIGEQ